MKNPKKAQSGRVKMKKMPKTIWADEGGEWWVSNIGYKKQTEYVRKDVRKPLPKKLVSEAKAACASLQNYGFDAEADILRELLRRAGGA